MLHSVSDRACMLVICFALGSCCGCSVFNKIRIQPLHFELCASSESDVLKEVLHSFRTKYTIKIACECNPPSNYASKCNQGGNYVKNKTGFKSGIENCKNCNYL